MALGRTPTARLLLAGLVLLVAGRALPSGRAGTAAVSTVIHVDEAQIARARRTFVAETGRAPDAAELRGVVDAAVDDEILYREARALGLDRLDPVVQRRLVSDAASVDEDGPGDVGAGYGTALALGMDRGDVVVRRRLIGRMRALLEEDAPAAEPGDDELRAVLARDAARFALPPRVRLTQIALPAEAVRPGASAEASTLLRRLRERPAGSDAACAPGASCAPLPPLEHLAPQSERDLARLFGATFAARVFALPEGRWSGPLASPLGLHLVRVDAHEPARTPPLDAVRNQLRALVLRERAEAALRRGLARLRARYQVRVAGTAEAAG